MIPTDLEQRERLIRFVQIELIAAWLVCDRADALAKCPTDLQREKFREMAIRTIDLVEGYSEEMPEPSPGRERKRTYYGKDSDMPEEWTKPKTKAPLAPSYNLDEREEYSLFGE